MVDSSEKIKKLFDVTGPNGKNSYTARYNDVCENLEKEGNALRDTIAAFSGSSYSVTTDGATASFVPGQKACSALVSQKIDAYRDTAELIQTQNIVDSFTDDREIFTTELKENYQRFLLQWTIYTGELSKIKNKWPSKTKTQNQG